MKVLHINTNDSGGGAGDFAFDFVHNSGVDAHLLVKTKKINSRNITQFSRNFLDHSFSFGDKILWNTGIKKTVKQIFSLSEEYHFTFKKLRNLKEYINSDIVHLHNIHGEYFDLSALEKIANEKPIVWSLHDMWSMTGGEAFTFNNENYKLGIGNTPYNTFYPLLNPSIDRRQNYLEMKKKIYHKIADKLVFVPGCNWLGDCLRSSYVWNEKTKIKVIHEGIDSSVFFDLGQRNWIVPRILIINTDNPFKGAKLFDKIFAKFTGNFELHIIGNPLKPDFNALQPKLYNYISDKHQLANLFNSVDILIFPSEAENFALTTLSAMSCGVCVVANSVGGLTEQMQEGNGVLFNYANLNDLLSKLKKLIENISQARAIGKKASQTVKEKYDVKKMYNKYEILYSELINSSYAKK